MNTSPEIEMTTNTSAIDIGSVVKKHKERDTAMAINKLPNLFIALGFYCSFDAPGLCVTNMSFALLKQYEINPACSNASILFISVMPSWSTQT